MILLLLLLLQVQWRLAWSAWSVGCDHVTKFFKKRKQLDKKQGSRIIYFIKSHKQTNKHNLFS